MFRTITLALLLVIPTALVWAQSAEDVPAESEASTTDDDATESDPAEPEPEADEEAVEFDETGLDDQGFSNEDDDFNPSEDIPADQSIEFPADI